MLPTLSCPAVMENCRHFRMSLCIVCSGTVDEVLTLVRPNGYLIILFIGTDVGDHVSIRQLVIDDSSQSLIGRYVTSSYDFIHSNGNYVCLPENAGTLSMLKFDDHSYISFDKPFDNDFVCTHHPLVVHACPQARHNALDWKATKQVIDMFKHMDVFILLLLTLRFCWPETGSGLIKHNNI